MARYLKPRSVIGLDITGSAIRFCSRHYRVIATCCEDILHTGFTNPVTQVIDLVSDLLVAPTGIFLLEPNHQINHLREDGRSTCILTVLGSIILFSDELVIPTHHSICRKQLCALFQHFSAEPFSFGSNPHALTVGQDNPFVIFFLMFNEYANLFPEIVIAL